MAGSGMRHSARIASRACSSCAATAGRGEPSRPAVHARSSLCHGLLDRQTDASVARTFEKRCVRQRFANLRPRVTSDLFEPADASLRPNLAALYNRRAAILEIVIAGGLIFGLADSGICAAFDQDTGRRICVLNESSCDVIRSLFHNRSNCTLIIVSVNADTQYSSLHCRAWCAAVRAVRAVRQSRPALRVVTRALRAAAR